MYDRFNSIKHLIVLQIIFTLNNVIQGKIISKKRGHWIILFKMASIMLEVFVLSLSIYFVSVSVLLLSGPERFPLIMISVSVVRHLIEIVLEGHRAADKLSVYIDTNPTPILLAFVKGTMVPFLAHIILVFGIAIAIRILDIGTGDSQFLGLTLLMGFQIIFGFGLWMISCLMRKLLPQISLYIVMTTLVMVVILSPVFFLLRDLPAFPSLMLTSLNPISHILAAYHSTIWYGAAPSAEVLPWLALMALAFGVASSAATTGRVWVTGFRLKILNWRPRPSGVTARELANLIVWGRNFSDQLQHGGSKQDIDAVIQRLKEAKFDDFIDQPVSILTDSKMVLLVLACAGPLDGSIDVDETLPKLIRDEDLRLYLKFLNDAPLKP